MKVGDLVRYEHPHADGVHTGIILKFEHSGEVVIALWQDGDVEEVERDYCEVISESR